MKLEGKHAVITGGAGGIGAALARRFHDEGAAAVTLADLPGARLDAVAGDVGGLAVACDVTKEAEVQDLVERAEAAHGPIDVFCSNAGVALTGDETAPDADWRLNWELHVMAHVYAARSVAPGMAARGAGYLVITASAAGLLTHTGSATYAVTKHAAVALAEWLAIAYGDKGVRVSVLCPQAVRTAMIAGRESGVASIDGVLTPEEVAECVVETMAREEFLILPHPQVLDYMQFKAGDVDRWLGGMRKLRAKYPDGI